MKLPQTIKIGQRHYTVAQPQSIRRPAVKGDIDFADRVINVARYSNPGNYKYTPKERGETFWHEVTHGILHDMDHPLYSDEKFVTAFANRLNNAIHSAKF